MPYIIRDTNTPLWKAFKERAAKEGHPLRWLLEELIRRYVERGLDEGKADSQTYSEPTDSS
jgi:hypothetical protein